MSRLVAYADLTLAADTRALKRAILAFDELRLAARLGFNTELPDGTGAGVWHHPITPEARVNLEWLAEHGVASVYGFAMAYKSYRPWVGPLPPSRWRTVFETTRPTPQWEPFDDAPRAAMALATAAGALGADHATLLLPDAALERLARPTTGPDRTPGRETVVLDAVVREMPVPDDAIPWEAVLDWRRDPDAVVTYRRLRAWVSRLVAVDGTGDARPRHVEDELLVLIDEYRADMRRHRMQVRTARARSLLVPLLDLPGKLLLPWRLGEWANRAFDLRERVLALHEHERNMPGREVAYIVDAQDRFGVASRGGR